MINSSFLGTTVESERMHSLRKSLGIHGPGSSYGAGHWQWFEGAYWQIQLPLSVPFFQFSPSVWQEVITVRYKTSFCQCEVAWIWAQYLEDQRELFIKTKWGTKESSGSRNWSENHVTYMLKYKFAALIWESLKAVQPSAYDQAGWAETGREDSCHLTYQKTDGAYLT